MKRFITFTIIALLLSVFTMSAGAAEWLKNDWHWEANSTYENDPDTVIVFNDSTAVDSLVIYTVTGKHHSGYFPTVIIEFDSAYYTTGDTTLAYTDSIDVKAYPRVLVPRQLASPNEPDGAKWMTLWEYPLYLYDHGGTICQYWSPTAAREYYLTNTDQWNKRHYQGITYVILTTAKDVFTVNKVGTMELKTK